MLIDEVSHLDKANTFSQSSRLFSLFSMAPWAAARGIIVAAVSSSLEAKQPSSTETSRSSQLCFGLEAVRLRWASQYSLKHSISCIGVRRANLGKHRQ
eukprot:6015850-Amphidinium_carterae.1